MRRIFYMLLAALLLSSIGAFNATPSEELDANTNSYRPMGEIASSKRQHGVAHLSRQDPPPDWMAEISFCCRD